MRVSAENFNGCFGVVDVSLRASVEKKDFRKMQAVFVCSAETSQQQEECVSYLSAANGCECCWRFGEPALVQCLYKVEQFNG
jgi:hypothetical protein